MKNVKIPVGLHWSCHHEGVCCTAPDVELSAIDRQRIEAVFAERPMDREYLHLDPDSPGKCLLKKVNGRCVFLTDENYCAIHSAAGSTSKPQSCRQFPFIFTDTPDAIQVGVSFACPSAIQNKGVPLEDHRSEIESLLSGGAVVLQVPELIELTEGLPLAWGDYLLIEEELRALLSLRALSVEQGMIAGNVYLGMANLFVRQALSEGRTDTSGAIRFFAESMQAGQYARLTQIARRSNGSLMLQRAFLGMMIAFRNTLSAKHSVPGVVARILTSYARHWLRVGSIRIAPLDRNVRYADFQRVSMTSDAAEMDEIFRRVMIHAIERKDLLRGGDLMRAHGLLLIFCAMIRWYAKALAAAEHEIKVQPSQLIEAISLAERYYGAHSRFFDLFQQYPVLNGIFYSVLSQKNFAHSMMMEV